jgi:Mg-chelatase subunit ChlD
MTGDLTSLATSTLNSSVLTASKYGGGTPIGAAIRDGAHYLEANHRDLDINGNSVRKLMVLMSDGYANKPDGNGEGYAVDMAAYAASLEITIHTISLGNNADTALMASIANATGGEHFPATGTGSELANQLDQAYRAIADTINRTILVE